eukprot:gene25871-32375_t
MSQFSDIRDDFYFVKSRGDPDALTKVGLLTILQHGHNLTRLSLCNLEKLSVDSSDLDITVDYNACSKLTVLELANCPLLTDNSIRIITKHCTKLVELDIHLCPELTDAALEFVAPRNPALGTINLSCLNKITDVGVLAISKYCPDFVAGNFNGVSVTDKSIIALAQNCPKMARVTTKMNSNITDAAMEAIAQHLPHYESIGLGALNLGFFGSMVGLGVVGGGMMQGLPEFVCPVTSSSLNAVAVNCAKMHTFDLSNCSDIDGTVRLIAERCPLLKRLFISKSGNVTEDTLMYLTQQSLDLTIFEAPKCICVTDATLSSLAEHCPKLVWLDISSTKITDVGVRSIAKYCKSMSHLSLDWCKEVTSASVVEVTVQCPLLVKLHCCPVRNSSAILLSLVENCPFMMDISVSVDGDVSKASYMSVCKSVQMAFPRVHFTNMKILSQGFVPGF